MLGRPHSWDSELASSPPWVRRQKASRFSLGGGGGERTAIGSHILIMMEEEEPVDGRQPDCEQ